MLNQNLIQNVNKDVSLRIFCFPYAGGSANIYNGWQKKVSADIAICPIQLPGRWDRISEEPYTRISNLVADLFDVLVNYTNTPYVLFGHSMGALICFELYRKLREQNCSLPKHLFMSAGRAPHLKKPAPNMFKFNDKDFIAALGKIGMPFSSEIMQEKEMFAVFMKILRADFEVIGTHEHKDDEKISTPMTVYGGLHDTDVLAHELEACDL